MRQVRLPLPARDYRFDLLLEFVKRIAYPARLIVHDDTLWRYVGGRLLAYRQAGDALHVMGAGLSAENEARLCAASASGLGFGRDLSAFYDFARGDETLWRILEPVAGFPLISTETVFEALITLVIEQHITWKNALRAQRTLMRMFGPGAPVFGQRLYDFPAPRQLAELEPTQLKPLKITDRRASLIIEVARAAHRGDRDLESLGALEPQAAYDQLLRIKGVGHWTAGNVIGRALGQYPFVSHNDVALQAAVRHYFFAGAGEKSAAQVVETLGPCGEFAGLVGHFLLLRWVLDRYPPVAQPLKPKARRRAIPD